MSTVQSSGTDLTSSILQQALAASTVTPSTTASTSAVAGATTTASSMEDTFLKLLVAQMNNQDPLNPLDNSQVTSQMAQISTVSGIQQLNQTMSSMASLSGAQSPLDAVSAIGRTALVAGDTITRVSATDGPVNAGFQLASAADAVQVDIVDASGASVYSQQLGQTAAGINVFQWDGTGAAAGTYRVKVTATASGKAVTATPLITAPVLGVSQTSGGVQLELAGQAGVLVKDLKAIL